MRYVSAISVSAFLLLMGCNGISSLGMHRSGRGSINDRLEIPPLHKAVINGNVDAVRLLLEQNANPDQKACTGNPLESKDEGVTPLLLTTMAHAKQSHMPKKKARKKKKKNLAEIAELLLKYGAKNELQKTLVRSSLVENPSLFRVLRKHLIGDNSLDATKDIIKNTLEYHQAMEKRAKHLETQMQGKTDDEKILVEIEDEGSGKFVAYTVSELRRLIEEDRSTAYKLQKTLLECAHCGQGAQKKCFGCSQVVYCNAICQRAHRKEHKAICTAYSASLRK